MPNQSNENQELKYVRKCDHQIEINVPGVDDKRLREFLDAIHRVEPSLVRNSLVIEVFQPLRGRVANTICQMVQNGVLKCNVWTLLPNRPDLIEASDRGHLVYRYQGGQVVDHRNPMTRIDNEGEEHMLHEIEVEFDEFHVETNEWDGTHGLSARPSLSIIARDGIRIE